MKTKLTIFSIFVISALLVSACSALPSISGLGKLASPPTAALARQAPQTVALSAPANPVALPLNSSTGSTLAAMQGTLEALYTGINPSVVNIQVTSPTSSARGQQNQASPQGNSPSGLQMQHALGSGFVWDSNGDIVTNNHVVDGANSVTVTFSDGRVLTAKVIGQDPDADLAVIKVDNAGQLTPLQMANSDQVKVGELAVAIGNPFGLSGTMTVGYVSALGRTLNANEAQTGSTPSYTIPDVIQTDAAINPGNSGGVLLNDQGQVIGVTAAIESSGQSNSGIGFVIPANIVSQVVPELIKNGKYEHAYLGISGTDMTPQLASAMNLGAGQRGALVVSVAAGGPADKAGLKGSTQTVTIDGLTAHVGGDVIVAIDGQKVNSFDDLVSILFKNGVVGQSVKVDILRGGSSLSVNVVLAARPASAAVQPQQQANNQNPAPRLGSPRMSLGIAGINLDATLAQAMNLKQDQQGVLVERVQTGGPADKAGLMAGTTPFTYQGQQVMVGGDVITGAQGSPVTSLQDLRLVLSSAKAGDQIQLTILRNGKAISVNVTLPGN